MNLICAQTGDDAIIKFGAVFDNTLGDAMRVTVVATGLSLTHERDARATPAQAARPVLAPVLPTQAPLPPLRAGLREGSQFLTQRANGVAAGPMPPAQR
jgi:hypothetical protein